MAGRWRTGRKLGRTIYVQVGDRPSDGDHLIGVMDTPGLAQEAVDGVNAIKLIPVNEAEDQW